MNQNNYVAIMAGGIGSRFWPMSRENFPKQFLDILNTGETLLQSTFKRFKSFIPVENIYMVTSESYREIIRQQLPELPDANIIGEPMRRNTAPCIAYISEKIDQINPDARLIVAPSDHMITDQQAFEENCQQAFAIADEKNALVTLGIQPTHANTGYGYIHYEKKAAESSLNKVKRFTEKPDLNTARSFLESGEYLWNSGIFIWKVSTILEAFKKFEPVIFNSFKEISGFLNTPDEAAKIEVLYKELPSISIDYAIMEKAQNVYVIPVEFSWSDLGTWNSAWENFEKDKMKNAINSPNTLVFDSNNCLVHSGNKKLLVVGGVKNLIIVDTPDALLVCNRDNEQMIKEYISGIHTNSGKQN